MPDVNRAGDTRGLYERTELTLLKAKLTRKVNTVERLARELKTHEGELEKLRAELAFKEATSDQQGN